MADRKKAQSGNGPGSLTAAEVANQIRAIPKNQGLQAGDRIGAERELAERFEVGRWIIRKALDQLEVEGLILRTNGRSGGVFVAPHKVMRDVSELVGLPQYLQAQGMEAGTTVLGTQLLQVDDELAKKLEVASDSWVYQIDRLRLADGIPLSVESVRVPAELFPGLLNESLVGGIYDLLEERYGIERGEAIETVSAIAAARDEAASLQIPVGTPILVVDRTARLTSGLVFEASVEHYRADRIAVVVHTGGSHRTMRKVT